MNNRVDLEAEAYWASISVDYLKFPKRLANTLRSMNIYSISDLLQHTEISLLRTPGLGIKSLILIRNTVTDRGLSLGRRIVT